MRTITQIYDHYKIMPILAMHQLRVASVAIQLCESLNKQVDMKAITTACLLHDMGNIIKFKIDYFPEALEPQGLTYWQNVQNEYFEKYGHDEHSATLKICEEIGVTSRVNELVDTVGFSQACPLTISDDLERKICCYADFRVAPHSVVSIEGRLIDGRERYKDRLQADIVSSGRKEREQCMYTLEEQIFTHSKIKPEDISDASIAQTIETLKNYKI